MLELGWLSAKLFFKGKLIRNPIFFLKQTTIGITIGFLLLVLLAQAPIPFYLPIILSSLVTGVIMPFLFKDFKTK
jgi:pilus assembly protein TadC